MEVRAADSPGRASGCQSVRAPARLNAGRPIAWPGSRNWPILLVRGLKPQRGSGERSFMDWVKSMADAV